MKVQGSGTKAEELAQYGLVDRIRFSALREKGKFDPEGLASEPRHHGCSSRASWFVAIEEHGEELHPSFMQERYLLIGKQAAHECHRRHAKREKLHDREEALDEDEVFSTLHAVKA
jgi:hypothetical protein